MCNRTPPDSGSNRTRISLTSNGNVPPFPWLCKRREGQQKQEVVSPQYHPTSQTEAFEDQK